MNSQGANFRQGRLVRPRGVEPSDAEAFARWNLDSEAAREHRRRGDAAAAAPHEKPGFVREGALRRMVYTGGRFHDLRQYGMLKEEWEQSPLKI